MAKPQYEQLIRDVAKEMPEMSQRGIARVIIERYSIDMTEDAMKYHVKKALENIAEEEEQRKEEATVAVEEDIKRYEGVTSEKRFKRQYDVLLGKYSALQEAYDDMVNLSRHNVRLTTIKRDAKHLSGQAVPIMQWSDWHVEKNIEYGVMNGLNSFTPIIAKQRATTLFKNTARMIEIHGSANTISQGILHLGGDFIEGYLREHNLRENTMTPIEAVVFAAELICSGITHLLDTGAFDTLWVLCNRGNHPRLTHKMDSDDHRMNLETLIYHMVMQYFKSNKKVVFNFPPSDIGYFDIMGKTIRFIHGHQIKYNGGVGTLTIPLRKAILNWDATKKADYTMMGHFHQSYKPLHNVIMNGSLCGYDPYAMSVVKAEFQHPLQSMEMLVEGRGFRMFTSIDCE